MITLADIAKASTNPMQKGFILDLLRNSDLLSTFPFSGVNALQVTAKRWQTLPSVGFRKFGGGYSESTGRTEDIGETLALLGGDIKLDKVADKITAVVEKPVVTQMKMKAKAVAFQFADTFINGDNGVDPDAFEGLKKRVSNMPARMTIDLATAGDSLKVKANTANMNAFLDAMHKALKYVGGATHIWLNEDTLVQFGSVIRNLGMPYDAVELYDRKFDSFQGIPLIDVGLKGDKATEIITSTEDPGDAGNDSTSIYVARVDESDGLHGIQLDGTSVNVYDPLNGNEMEGSPAYLRRIDWAVGLASNSQYCICRIKGFKMAAA